MAEGEAADDEIAESRRRTTSRRQLAQNELFENISPDVGELDESAVEQALAETPDDLLALMADLVGATDQRLRDLARRLAGRLFLDIARSGPTRPRGTGRMTEQPYRPDLGDIDIDASFDAIASARAANEAIDPEQIRVRAWTTPDTAICLLVDRSGSMGGEPLATSAVAAAAVACRAPTDYSVLSFAKSVIAVKSQDVHRATDVVVDGVLALRGSGSTDLAAALRAARVQVDRSAAARRIVILLSDCRATEEGDVVAAATALDELVIVAPHGEHLEAEQLAMAVGARFAVFDGPSSVPGALTGALGR